MEGWDLHHHSTRSALCCGLVLGKLAVFTIMDVALLIILVSRVVGVISAIRRSLIGIRTSSSRVRLPVRGRLSFPRLRLLLLISTAIVSLLLVECLLLLLM